MNSASNVPHIMVFAGSSRIGSVHRRLARVAADAVQQAGGQATLIDLRDYPMPLYDGDLETDQGLPETAKALKNLARQQDAYVIASPEYNGSFSGLLKNTIDWMSRTEAGERPLAVFRGKTVALIGASPGPGGGARGLKHLRELLQGIGMKVLAREVTVAKASNAFDDAGALTRPEVLEAVQLLAQDLVNELTVESPVA